MLLLNELYDLPPFVITLGYFGLFIYFISLDLITPVPDEVSLLTIGFLCSKGTFNPLVAGAVSLAAFTTIDLVYYYMTGLGNKWSQKVR